MNWQTELVNVLTTAFEDLGKLNSPIMVLALRGWFDIAEVATDAVETLAADRVTPVVAAIDPDPFFDFTQERPTVVFDDAELRQINWPENEFRIARLPESAHDLVLLAGVEPHLRYATFADAIIEVAVALGCEVVVTVGAAPEAVPHSRPPQVVGSSTTVGLARALGLGRPKYEGVTGLVGVLQERLERAGIPAVSLRVGVPHYLGNAKHPQSSEALLGHLEHVLGISASHSALAEDAMRWRSLHDEAVAEDEHAAKYVELLESEYDKRMEAAIPSADDLAAEFEKFLREQRDD
ncbi:filament polymerization regulator ParJ [soil metagenome]